MKQIAFCLAMALVSTMAQAGTLTLTVDGKKITVDSTKIHHEIKETDREKGNQASAMACSFLLYSLLAKGDIEGAAKLSTDPAKAVEKWTNYQERVGTEFFKKSMNDYFTSGNVVLAEIVYAEDTMLVIRTEDGAMAQFYRKTGGEYLATDRPAAGKTLGAILNMVQEGKLKL